MLSIFYRNILRCFSDICYLYEIPQIFHDNRGDFGNGRGRRRSMFLLGLGRRTLDQKIKENGGKKDQTSVTFCKAARQKFSDRISDC